MEIKAIFKNKIGHQIFYTWWFIIPVLPGIHDCGIAFTAVWTRACSNVTIFDNRCCFVCSFAVPWINVNWVVLSWDRCDFKSIAWTYFTILERFTNLLTIFKGYRVHIIGTIPLFQVRIEIIINKSIRKTVPSHLLPGSCLGDDINCTNCINYWGWIWNFWSVLSNYCAISNISLWQTRMKHNLNYLSLCKLKQHPNYRLYRLHFYPHFDDRFAFLYWSKAYHLLM